MATNGEPPDLPRTTAVDGVRADGTGPLVERDFDPSNSLALQQELPGLQHALDDETIGERLRAALFGQPEARGVVERCAVDQATYILGEGVVLRYLLTFADTLTGESHTAVVSGRLFPSATACAAYVHERLVPLAVQAVEARREDLAPFAATVAAVEPLHMAVHVFPIDADLPTLLGATDRQRLRTIFADALPAARAGDFEVADCRAELVDYGRERRATLRYHVAGPARHGGTFQQIVYGKLTGDGTGVMAGAITEALRERVQLGSAIARFAVPDVYDWLPDLQLSLLEALPGASLLSDMVKARLRGKPEVAGGNELERLLETCGQIAATLHTSQLALGRRRTLDDELAALRQALTYIRHISPALGAQIERRIDRIAAAATRTAALPLCFNHGDFTHGQVLSDGAATGLIDFDSVCQAEPALDLGQFLTYLRLTGLKSKLAPEATSIALAKLQDHFMDAYRAASGIAGDDAARLYARVALYRNISLLRRIVRSWQKFKPSRILSALKMLDEEGVALS
jgi:hypothetical protein